MRSVYCGVVNTSNIDQEITLCGWVDRRRDHGGVIFIDLRDREGIVQVVFDPDAADKFALADKVRPEYVLRVTGKVPQLCEITTSSSELVTRDSSHCGEACGGAMLFKVASIDSDAERAYTMHSSSELLAMRLAPCRPVNEVSPIA